MGIFAITIAVLFIILSAYIIFSDGFSYIPFNYRIIFGCLLFVYGFFRLVSIYYNVNTGNKLIDKEEEE